MDNRSAGDTTISRDRYHQSAAIYAALQIKMDATHVL